MIPVLSTEASPGEAISRDGRHVLALEVTPTAYSVLLWLCLLSTHNALAGVALLNTCSVRLFGHGSFRICIWKTTLYEDTLPQN